MKFLRFFIFYSIIFSLHAEKAFVIYPVINCIGEPFINTNNLEEKYKNIPHSWAGEKNDSCPRIHQLLLHEEVTILEKRDQQIKIEIPNIICLNNESNYNHNQFWTLNSYVLSEDKINNYDELKQYLPEQINIHHPIDQINKTTITLAFPFYNKITHTIYSSGTRFRMLKIHEQYIESAIYDPIKNEFQSINIPKNILIDSYQLSWESKRKLFVELLHTWIKNPTGSIPFVWGGSSLTEFVPMKNFEKQSFHDDAKTSESWFRENLSIPYSGFDSSGLILRAAQMCGLPYFAKNTMTASLILQEINRYDRIQEGDLIWIPGGLMIISDLKHHKVISAFGYQFGYGAVVELPIHEIFAGVTTIQELVKKYFSQEPLKSNMRDKTFEQWSLYKLF